MRRNKKNQNNNSLLVIALIVLAVLAAPDVPPTDTTQSNNTSDGDVPASIGGGFWLGGGGGGGGSPPPASTGDDGCVGDCPAVWVEDEPVRSTRGGLLDMFQFAPLIPLTMGKWTCEGVCKNEQELCLFDPTDVIPDGGYINKDNPPNCVCLKPQAGACNFYDDNYGVGEENIICGGSCPKESQCMRFNHGSVDVCKCMYSPYSDKCGLHHPEQYLGSSSGEFVVPNGITEKDCYGYCDIRTVCTYGYTSTPDKLYKVPICYCPELPSQQEEQDEEPDTIIYCESIEKPRSQSDCDVGACTVLMYGVECLYGIDARLGTSVCYCGVPEDVEPTEDPLKTSILPDKILTTTTFIRR